MHQVCFWCSFFIVNYIWLCFKTLVDIYNQIKDIALRVFDGIHHKHRIHKSRLSSSRITDEIKRTLTWTHTSSPSLLSNQIPVPRTHRGHHIPEFFASHPGGDGDGDGGSPDLERSNVPAGSDQMGLSTDIWLSPFLHVKVYHGSGSVDSPQPPGGLCSGCHPWGKSLKNNLDSLNKISLYLGKVTVISIKKQNKKTFAAKSNENDVCCLHQINSW